MLQGFSSLVEAIISRSSLLAGTSPAIFQMSHWSFSSPFFLPIATHMGCISW